MSADTAPSLTEGPSNETRYYDLTRLSRTDPPQPTPLLHLPIVSDRPPRLATNIPSHFHWDPKLITSHYASLATLPFQRRIVMFRPGLKPKSRPSQAQIGRARPGQNHGLKRLLAWPSMSPGQGQAAKPRLLPTFFSANLRTYIS